MDLEAVKNVAEAAQAIVTAVGLSAAGWWFFTSRNLAANLRISITVKHLMEYSGSHAAVATVVIKNIGRTKVDKQQCTLYLREFTSQDISSPIARRIDPEPDKSLAEVYPLFNEHTEIEPNEEIIEDVTIAFGASMAVKLWVEFATEKYISWESSAVVARNMTGTKADSAGSGTSQ